MDLGTTNTAISRWDSASERPRLIELSEICRQAGGDNHLEAPRLIPSASHVLEDISFWGRVAKWRLLSRRVFWGQHALIGRPALDANEGEVKPNFVRSFKTHLGHAPFRILARAGTQTFTTRDIARTYVRELFAEVKRTTGERIRELVVTTPVESFESYRAEVSQLLKRLGVRKIRFIDEPVAAALGYGLSLRNNRAVLVVDFGGGTLDLALVMMTAKDVQAGRCEVIAKEGRQIGGNLVDRWLLHEFCERLDFPLAEDAEEESTKFWYRLMLHEACRVKEQVFFKEKATFTLMPPEEMRSWDAQVRGTADSVEVTKTDLGEILEKNGLYKAFEDCIDGLSRQAQVQNIRLDDVEDVLMVGGSTLLPGVYKLFEERFGRGRVRAFQPFEAVAYGAAAFSADAFQQSDYIVHDYAFVTYDPKTNDRIYTTIVPRGTRFPTPPDFWKRRLIPTCSRGEPETVFKLVICEVGRQLEGERRFSWDKEGNLHKLGGDQSDGGTTQGGNLIVPLNEASPTLGYLKPPHPPSERKPRLEISFGINADRWLSATVFDLQTKKMLMEDEPVVKLL